MISDTEVGINLPDCTKGYAVEDPGLREALKIGAYIIWALGGIWIIAVCFLQKRIRLAVAVNKVAAGSPADFQESISGGVRCVLATFRHF